MLGCIKLESSSIKSREGAVGAVEGCGRAEGGGRQPDRARQPPRPPIPENAADGAQVSVLGALPTATRTSCARRLLFSCGQFLHDGIVAIVSARVGDCRSHMVSAPLDAGSCGHIPSAWRPSCRTTFVCRCGSVSPPQCQGLLRHAQRTHLVHRLLLAGLSTWGCPGVWKHLTPNSAQW